MAFDGIVVSAAASELSNMLIGGKIEKIYQPESDELVFHVHTPASNYKLYVSSGSGHARFHILTKSLENPQTPFAFCMLLRKHLTGGRITQIRQPDSERILEINIDTMNELGFSVSKTLLIEIMGKHSNIILTDTDSHKIIDSIKRISFAESRVRQVLPGKVYEYPPTQGKIPFHSAGPHDIERMTSCPKNALSKNLLSGIQGISPGIAGQLADSFAAGDEHGESVYTELASMRERLESKAFTPMIYLDEQNKPIDFHIFPISGLDGLCSRLEFDTINECIEAFYFSKTGLNRVRQKTSDLARSVRNSLDKLYLKKQRLSEDILNAQKADLYKLYGELLTANLHVLHAGTSEAVLISYYDNAEVVIPLDKRLSPSKNAQHYFKKYSKARTAVKEKTIQLAENDNDINYLESVYSFIENASSADEIESLRSELIEEGFLRKRKSGVKRPKDKPAPFHYTTSGGFSVMAGRNNKENDLLTFKSAARTDIWFHTKDIPGSHVILFTGGGSPGETDIFEAASIAAFHSKGKNSENIPVDYTQVKYVKKTAGAKPGMVIFTNNKTVYVNPAVTGF